MRRSESWRSDPSAFFATVRPPMRRDMAKRKIGSRISLVRLVDAGVAAKLS